MAKPENLDLPHGVSGIEAGEFAIEFREDKIIAVARGRSEHYTVHVGRESSVLDVHRTWKDQVGREHHKTVFAMRHDDLARLLMDLAPAMSGFPFLRPLRVGWLHRHGIGVIRGLEPMTTEQIAAVTSKTRKRKRLIVDEEKLRESIVVPEYLEDVYDFRDGAFSLMDRNKRIGIAFKITDPAGRAQLRWFKIRDATRFFKTFEGVLLDAAKRYAIPEEEYSHYPFLAP